MKFFTPIVAVLCLIATGCVQRVMPPTEFACAANRAWQNTGLLLHPGDRLTVQYENGQWTADIRDGLTPPAGNPNTPGRPGDVLPSAPRSSLIGRVGQSVFLIGNGFDGIIPEDGRLYCVINTTITDSDGRPFLPTDGTVTMRAWITRANPVCNPKIGEICL